MKVTAWRSSTNNGLITFVLQMIRSGVTVTPITVTHSWKASPAGLVLTTTTMVGINSGIGRINAGGGKTANMLAIEGYCNGESVQDAVTRNILHFVQEYGNLENVIPMVLRARDGAVVSATGSRPAAAALLAEPVPPHSLDDSVHAEAIEEGGESEASATQEDGGPIEEAAAVAILEAHFAAEAAASDQAVAAPGGEVDDVATGH